MKGKTNCFLQIIFQSNSLIVYLFDIVQIMYYLYFKLKNPDINISQRMPIVCPIVETLYHEV